ncbi:MAG: acetyltransferase [Clostridiales bacterium]|jgi:sugar O-acyltransferase (sialic acid O-acetyltransferase NeuD family)|nr:acetyltransferase [Clostridiales bacterium]
MPPRDLILVGAGGLGREVLWQIKESCDERYNILGFVDDAPGMVGARVDGAPVLGDVGWLAQYPKKICVAICVANPKIRKSIYDELKANSNISFPTIIAGDVHHSGLVKFGQGCIICLSTILTVNVALGDFVIVNPHCSIAHDAVLGDFVTLYYNVNVAGNVRVGSGAEIGTGTSIIQGRTIGENAVVGAGSVVIRDIPANCTAVGVPAAPIKRNA